MRDVTNQNFGLLIAYVLPGVTALWGASYLSPTVRVWLGSAPADAPTVGGFLYLTIAAVAAGLIASTVRWAVVDTLHHVTGIPRPTWDFSRLQSNISAFNLIVEHQYRYYQGFDLVQPHDRRRRGQTLQGTRVVMELLNRLERGLDRELEIKNRHYAEPPSLLAGAHSLESPLNMLVRSELSGEDKSHNALLVDHVSDASGEQAQGRWHPKRFAKRAVRIADQGEG